MRILITVLLLSVSLIAQAQLLDESGYVRNPNGFEYKNFPLNDGSNRDLLTNTHGNFQTNWEMLSAIVSDGTNQVTIHITNGIPRITSNQHLELDASGSVDFLKYADFSNIPIGEKIRFHNIAYGIWIDTQTLIFQTDKMFKIRNDQNNTAWELDADTGVQKWYGNVNANKAEIVDVSKVRVNEGIILKQIQASTKADLLNSVEEGQLFFWVDPAGG